MCGGGVGLTIQQIYVVWGSKPILDEGSVWGRGWEEQINWISMLGRGWGGFEATLMNRKQ